MRGNKHLNNWKKSRAGLSTIELLVVVSLFTLLILIITDVYLISLRAQRDASLQQRSISTLRNAIELVTRQVRISTIDYVSYGGAVVSPEDGLSIINQEGQRITYGLNSGVIEATIDGDIFELTNINEVDVVAIDFFISPATDPFDQTCVLPCVLPDEQPRITMRIAYRAVSQQPLLQELQYIQTTILSRVYLR